MAAQETDTLLRRAYRGSIGLMVSAMAAGKECRMYNWLAEHRSGDQYYPDGTVRPQEQWDKNGKQWWLDDYFSES